MSLSRRFLVAVSDTYRRIDIKCYPRRAYAFALLYFTGSGHFNRSMRYFCKVAKLKLSEDGLWYKGAESPMSVRCQGEEVRIA